MTARGTLILAATFVALAAWVLLIELPADWNPPPPPPAVLAEPATTVTQLELTAGPTVVVARRGPAGWVNDRGEPWPFGAIDDLLATLATLRPLRTIVADADEAARYHIGQRRLCLRRADGSIVLDLELGDLNPAETALYARTTAQPAIVLLGSVLQWELRKLTPDASVDPRGKP